jgi:hypothetical protein
MGSSVNTKNVAGGVGLMGTSERISARSRGKLPIDTNQQRNQTSVRAGMPEFGQSNSSVIPRWTTDNYSEAVGSPATMAQTRPGSARSFGIAISVHGRAETDGPMVEPQHKLNFENVSTSEQESFCRVVLDPWSMPTIHQATLKPSWQ